MKKPTKKEKVNFNWDTIHYDPENAYILSRFSLLAYMEKAYIIKQLTSWGFPKRKFITRGDTQLLIAGNDDYIIVAFRGTESDNVRDWLTDAKVMMVRGSLGKVHMGFKIALSCVWAEVLQTIKTFQNKKQKLWFTGHSLGAALAVIATSRILRKQGKVQGIYTYGSPRPGNQEFATNMNKAIKKRHFRVVNNNDLVTRTPPRATGYRHVGSFRYISPYGEIHNDPAFWKRFTEGIRGYFSNPQSRYEDMTFRFADSFLDHLIEEYVMMLGRAIGKDPVKYRKRKRGKI